MPSFYEIQGPSGAKYRVPWNGEGEPTESDWAEIKSKLEPVQAPTQPIGPYGPYGPKAGAGFVPMGVGGPAAMAGAVGDVGTEPSARPSRSQRRRMRRKAAAAPPQGADEPTSIGSTFTGGRSLRSAPGAVDTTQAQGALQTSTSAAVTRPEFTPPPQPSITERMQQTPGTLEHTMLQWDFKHPHAPKDVREHARKGFAYQVGQVAKARNEAREQEAAQRYYAAAHRRGGLVPSLGSPAAESVESAEMREANEDYLQAGALRSGFPAHPTVMESVGGAIGGFGRALAEGPGSLAVSTTEGLGRLAGQPKNWWAGRDEDAAAMTGGAQDFFGGPVGEARAVDFATFWLPSAAMPIVIGQASSVVGHSMQTDPGTGEPVGLMGATGEAVKDLLQSVDFYPELHGGAPISPGERSMRGLMAGMAVLGLAHAGLKGWDWWKARSTPDLVRMAADHGITLQFRDAERLMSERDAAVHEQAGKLGTTPDAVEAEIAKAPKGKRPAKAAAPVAATPEVPAEGTTLPAPEVSGEAPTIEPPAPEPVLEGNPLSIDELRDIETRAPEMDDAARETHTKMLDEHRQLAETMGERIARICFGRGGGFSIE